MAIVLLEKASGLLRANALASKKKTNAADIRSYVTYNTIQLI